MKNILLFGQEVKHLSSVFIILGFAATNFWIVAFPTDVIKNRIMSQEDSRPLKYETITKCAKSIYLNEGGYRAFYRGFAPCLLRAFPTNASALFIFDLCMKLMK